MYNIYKCPFYKTTYTFVLLSVIDIGLNFCDKHLSGWHLVKLKSTFRTIFESLFGKCFCTDISKCSEGIISRSFINQAMSLSNT